MRLSNINFLELGVATCISIGCVTYIVGDSGDKARIFHTFGSTLCSTVYPAIATKVLPTHLQRRISCSSHVLPALSFLVACVILAVYFFYPIHNSELQSPRFAAKTHKSIANTNAADIDYAKHAVLLEDTEDDVEQASRQQPAAAPINSDNDAKSSEPATTSQNLTTDIVIIGAGVAGAALAASFGQRGYNVICIEKDLTEPHRIVGELLQPDGVRMLKQLGLGDCVEGIDSPHMQGYSMFMDGQTLALKYPPAEDGTQPEGRSYHHGRFVQSLRCAAQKHTSVQLIEGSVTKVLHQQNRVTGIQYKTKLTDDHTHTVRAPITFVCDGCFSIFRTAFSEVNHRSKVLSKFVGIILEIDNDKLPYPNRGHVVLGKPSPILAYPISSTETRMLIDFPSTLPSTTNGDMLRYLRSTIGPQLPEPLKEPFEQAVALNHFRSMPNSSMPARPNQQWQNVCMIGDALNMRHPLTGGGMTVALTDINYMMQEWDQLYPQQSSMSKSQTPLALTPHLDDNLHTITKHHYDRRHTHSACINILADALYDVFCDHEGGLGPACFSYLQKGGLYSKGPVELLSGISRSQVLLLVHFFAVALYCVYFLLKPFPTPARIYRCTQSFRKAVSILIPRIGRENNTWYVRGLCKAVTTAFWV